MGRWSSLGLGLGARRSRREVHEGGKMLLAALKGNERAPVTRTPVPPASMRARPAPMPLSAVSSPLPKQSPISPVLSTSPIGDGGSIISPSREKAPLLSSTPMQSPQARRDFLSASGCEARIPTPVQLQETEAVASSALKSFLQRACSLDVLQVH